MYPEAIVRDEAITIKNNCQSKIISKALFSGAKINIAERYCAKTITQMLYPLITEKRLAIFFSVTLDLRVSISLLVLGYGLSVKGNNDEFYTQN
jgi:hypothetical protein